MESEGVSLPWIHEHLMLPWNHLRKGDCCGVFAAITNGYYCELCDFFVHEKCSESSEYEYIEHPLHSQHTLQLRSSPDHDCNLCGREMKDPFYCCEICDFDMALQCAKYPPPEVIDISEMHHHKLTLLKEQIDFDCDAKCGKSSGYEFHYKCHDCDLAFHMDCVWHPLEVKHPLEYGIMDAGERVSLPWIHKHLMMPWNDLRKGDCCGQFEDISNGYYCESCDFFVHKKCGETAPEDIKHPSHSIHRLYLRSATRHKSCSLCGRGIKDLFYRCEICDFSVDLFCAKYPPPEVIDNSEMHHHKLTLSKEWMNFEDCEAKCGRTDDFDFTYKCHECDITFHLDCVWQPNITSKIEIHHSYHSLHPLTLTGQSPEYSDGKCRLCGREINDRLFYHCSSCNFTLGMCCVYKPPPQSLLDLKAHDHQLTLLPRLDSFKCNACGLKGDRSPYVCFQCGFMIHQDCLDLPRLININRHEHRISRTSVLGVVDSICGVCRKKVDWTCGGYWCQKCHGYAVHSKCATRDDVWNGKELEGVPEEIEDIEPYVLIDENTIQHFSHKEHYLRLHVGGVLYDENKRCNACIHPIDLQSFYGCIDCGFILHQNCAEFRKKKWHVLHNEHLTLVTTSEGDLSVCNACVRMTNGFMYQHGDKGLDVRCSSVLEPFDHPSHPDHPLYHIPENEDKICNGCNRVGSRRLCCIEDGCEFFLCFKCATIPQVIKHRVDDYPLSLCYGGEMAIGKYWCDICEKETNPEKWFYTCKDHRASLHIECVFGYFTGLMPRSIVLKSSSSSFEVVLNNSVSRPFCEECESHCMYPIILKKLGTSVTYICSYKCMRQCFDKILRGK